MAHLASAPLEPSHTRRDVGLYEAGRWRRHPRLCAVARLPPSKESRERPCGGRKLGDGGRPKGLSLPLGREDGAGFDFVSGARKRDLNFM